MVNIMKHLHVTDCASLALSCKHLARIAMDSQSLERDETFARDETSFWVTKNIMRPREFFARLQEGWGAQKPEEMHQVWQIPVNGRGVLD